MEYMFDYRPIKYEVIIDQYHPQIEFLIYYINHKDKTFKTYKMMYVKPTLNFLETLEYEKISEYTCYLNGFDIPCADEISKFFRERIRYYGVNGILQTVFFYLTEVMRYSPIK